MNDFTADRSPAFAGRGLFLIGCLLTGTLLAGSKPVQPRHTRSGPGNPPSVSGLTMVAGRRIPVALPSSGSPFDIRSFPSMANVPTGSTPYRKEALSTLACGAPEGGFTQNAANNGTYQWAGPTASTVSVTMTTDINNMGEQVVVPETMSGSPSWSFANSGSTKVFTETTQLRWHKNGGFTNTGASVNNYIGRVNLSFSNPVPANEIFIMIMDMDTRGIDNTAPDGSITFTASSQAKPADFEQLTWTNAPAGASSSTYNTADGSIAFGIGTNPPPTGYNKYLALTGIDGNTVSEIRIFMRNVADDVGIYVGWLNPCPTALPVTLKSFQITAQQDGNMLKWSTSAEENFDRFLIGRNADASTEFGTVAEVSGGRKEYSFLDRSPERGTSYYRLKMLDRDGSYQYSQVRSIDRQLERQVYPNPSFDRVWYVDRETGLTSGSLIGISGKRYTLTMQETQNRYRFQAGEDLPKGIYILECRTAEGKVLRRKVVLE